MLADLLVRSCAPTMARLKTGNMFNCSFSDREEMLASLRQLNITMACKGLRVVPLRWREGKALIYVYRPRMLERDLGQVKARQLLGECGYPCGNPNACLARLIDRLRDDNGFPDEIGLFLGYPPADVDGFMHRKEECKLCGLWKVYDDVEAASRQFARCRRCKAEYLRRYHRGCSLASLAVAE